MQFEFENTALADLKFWKKTDKAVYERIFKLLKDIEKSPTSGLGKPEPLKYQLKEYWSRRITREHRLVYKILKNKIIVVQCRYHY